VLADKNTPVEIRSNALMLLAACEAKERNFPSAIGLLQELVPLRRYSEDWGLLGICYQSQQEPREALTALQKALAIRPDNQAIHAKLAEAYTKLGDQQRAAEHQEKVQWLAQHRP
jgi:tetratricopeptide (TPR) repeat protein